MRKISKGIAYFAIGTLVALTSCSDESPWMGAEGEGAIKLNLSSDGRVMRSTRADEADDSKSMILPAAEQFGVTLTKSDGSYNKKWSTLDGFNREKGFAIGDYTLTAEYTKPGANADDEGFEHAVYRGVSETIHVSPAETTTVSVTAVLANSMVSIRYTDEFKNQFTSYSAAIQTPGHPLLVYAKDENRPGYINPSDEVKLNITLTNEAGEQVTVQPASFEAKARHHQIVTIGVNQGDPKGDMTLDVVFEEEVVNETIEVPLGDELWTAPKPVVKAKGFDPDVEVETYENLYEEIQRQFEVYSFGGLRSATLNVINPDYTPTFGKSVELVNASELTQSQLANDGLECVGFFRNVDKLAIVKLPKFISKLPAGKYTVQLQVVDALTRTSAPTEFKFEVKPVDFELEANLDAQFMSNELSVDVATTCPLIKEQIVFSAPDANGRMVEVPVKSITDVSASAVKAKRSTSMPYKYRYVLEVSTLNCSVVDIKAQYGKKQQECNVTVDVPEFDVQIDAFAKWAKFKIVAKDAADQSMLIESLKVYNGSSQVLTSVQRDLSSGIITVNGLNANMNYTGMKFMLGSVEYPIPAFTTEAATDVTNGNFSATSQTINITGINVGGTYTGTVGSVPAYQTKSSIVRSTANGWADVNALTCNTASNPMNTWFVVPSTFAENGKVTVRSVGYNHSGTVPANYKKTGIYYCANAPTDAQLNKAAGELFLGSYSLTNRIDGVDFATRPSTMSFDYTYTSVNGEQAEVYVKVLDATGKVIASQSAYLNAASEVTTQTLTLNGYTGFGEKAAKLQICFKSTKTGVTPTINIPSGSALNDGCGLSSKTIAANTYKSFAMGSELVIDNVTLGYGSSASAKPAKRLAVKTRK